MTTNTVEIKRPGVCSTSKRSVCSRRAFNYALAALTLVLFIAKATAAPAPGPWTPIFKGVDLATGTNNPNIAGNFPRLQVVRCVRVDLTDPDIRVTTTPMASNYVAEFRETLTLSVPSFIRQNHVQIACDANFYSASPGGSDPSSEGITCEVYGLQISTGVVVSAQTTADAGSDPRYATILFRTNNQAQMIFVNSPPGTNTAGIYTAVTGYYPIVSNGVNIGNAASISYPDTFIHQAQPRTAYGLSQDNRYLFLMTIDGRQNGYSDGAVDSETAYWLIQFGAANGINMDGGGSTAMYMADSAGNPLPINHSSYVPGTGHERYIGSHFGVYAKPLPGFINDVNVLPDDTSAVVSWTTTAAASSQVQYGLTTNLGSSSTSFPTPVTNHTVSLTGLSPATGYYFTVISSDTNGQHEAGPFFFTTTNYVTSSLLFDLTNSWAYETTNLDGVNWTAPGFDDSGWSGSGPGLLWADIGGSPNPEIPVPTITQMPINSGTGLPFTTYYFRTHFTFTNSTSGVGLEATAYLDDGAVFYLNGQELYRMRMPAAPSPIVNATLASGYACSNSVSFGNAVCGETWSVALVTNLLVGDNVLAAEVHNYMTGSPDITFGLALNYTAPLALPTQLNIEQTNAALTVSWNRTGFTLQQADSPGGPWTNVPGPVTSSPYSISNSTTVQFFRLAK